MDHGHCGFISNRAGIVDLDNDKTLDLLVKQAVSHAKAGVDVVAPSGMIDGMVRAIRTGLDAFGFAHIPILSYSVKYNSPCMVHSDRQLKELLPLEIEVLIRWIQRMPKKL